MNTQQRNWYEIGITSLKLGCIGFGGIAGMVGLIENEIVTKKQWVSKAHYLDVVGTANIIPGPNSVEIIMHCARVKGGKTGLVIGGLLYILPAMLICLLWAYLYKQFGHLPAVEPFLYGIRPATTAFIVIAVMRLSKGLFKKTPVVILSIIVLAGSLSGLNEVLLLFGAGIAGALYLHREKLFTWFPFPLIFLNETTGKLFYIFLKIGAILYGSGYVLFAYMDEALVKNNHWLTRQQLTDAIAAGQITPGPILSSATFAGYLVSGSTGAIIATIAIFLPSFFISFFLFRVLGFINRHQLLRSFLDVVNAASIALIAAIAIKMTSSFFTQWRLDVILVLSLLTIIFTKMNAVWLILLASVSGYLLLLL